MPLVGSEDLLRRANEEGFAVGAFNVLNMEMVQAVIEAATGEEAPVILEANETDLQHAGLEDLSTVMLTAARLALVPVVVHLDHCTDRNLALRCLGLGYTSLMYDGSADPFDRNVEATRMVCQVAHAQGVPVEGELGYIPRAEGSALGEWAMTEPEDARRFVEATGVDSLAAAVGTAHGMRRQEALLDLHRISRIREAVGIPLVLHGGSGVPDDAIREAVARGIAKINVATQLRQTFLAAAARALAEWDPDLRQLLASARLEMKNVVREKIRLFGGSGKA